MRLRSLGITAIIALVVATLTGCGPAESPTTPAPAPEAPPPAAAPAPEAPAPVATPPPAPADEGLPLLRLPAVSAEGWEIGECPDWASLDHVVEISFWHAIAQRHEAALNEIIGAFEQAHPNISVNAVYQGGYGELFTALLAAMATGSRPVMSQMYESWTSQFVERDLAVPAQAFINADADYGEENLADFFPGFLANNTWGDTIVTLPFNKSVYLLYANLDMLDAAGLDVPETWDDLHQAALALNNPEEHLNGFGARPLMETFTPLFLMNGGQFIVDGQLNLDSPAAIETLDFLIQLAHRDEVTLVESNYLTSAFGNELVALFTGSSAGIPYTDTAVGEEYRWTAVPLPANGDHPRRVLSQGTNVGIYSGHTPEELWAAWEFLKFLTNTESSANFAQASGYLPVRRSSVEVPSFQAFLADNPNLAVATAQLEHASFEPRMPVWESIRATLNRQMGQMLSNPAADAEQVARRMTREAMADIEE